MIARALIFILPLILLPDFYREWRCRSRKTPKPLWKRLLAWLPSVAMLGYTAWLAAQPGFAPANMNVLFVYLFILALFFALRFVYMLCSLAGWSVARLTHSRRNYGNLVGLLLMPLLCFVLVYGTTVGFSKLEVKHVELSFADLPPAFDGYKLVLFSDAHVGNYGRSRQDILKSCIDSINAQQADLIAFTGDLQNLHPQELYPQIDLLSSLTARDGVVSVLGNHDYAEYIDADEVTKTANCRETQSLERQMGWRLLMNEHIALHRGADSIVIAGMENDGTKKRMPQLGDVAKTLKGISDGDFIVMLEHDPTCWKRKILPQSKAQLTLSGHTHGGQFALFGLSPVAMSYNEYDGLYRRDDGRVLYVTAGVGGLIPFRFGVPGEIVVITLRRK